MFAFLALGHSLFPSRRPTEQTEKEITKSHKVLDPTAVHGVTPFSDMSKEEFEELYTVVTLSLSLSLSKSLNCESVIVICLLSCLLLSFSLLYKFLLIFALFLELSVG